MSSTTIVISFGAPIQKWIRSYLIHIVNKSVVVNMILAAVQVKINTI